LGSSKVNISNLVSPLAGLLLLADTKGYKLTVTSANDSKHKSKKHYDGSAIDLRSKDGEFLKAIKDPDIKKYMKENGIYILNEVKRDTEYKNGEHYHLEWHGAGSSPSAASKQDTKALLGRVGGLINRIKSILE